jgi:hypothetical protein
VDPPVALRWIAILALIAWFAPNTQELMGKYRPALGFLRGESVASRYHWLLWRPSYVWSLLLALLSAVALMNMWVGDNAEFLYFQF